MIGEALALLREIRDLLRLSAGQGRELLTLEEGARVLAGFSFPAQVVPGKADKSS